MASRLETFSMLGGVKICELYAKLDDFGKFLFFNSVRKHQVGFHRRGMADGSYIGTPITERVCRTQFQGPSCEGCKMLDYHLKSETAEK